MLLEDCTGLVTSNGFGNLKNHISSAVSLAALLLPLACLPCARGAITPRRGGVAPAGQALKFPVILPID